MKPTISSLTASRIDGEVPSTWGIYVQTKSKVKLTINGAAGSYGSTIKSYSITGGGYSGSASTLTTGFLNNCGTITFKATVTDSRGRVSAEASVSITVTAYSPPYFNSSLSQRCLSNGTLDDDGTYIHALVSFGYSTCGGKNTLKTSVQYKQVAAEQWTDAGVTFASNTAFTYGRGQISTETSYDVRYTLEDAFSTISVQEIVSTAAVVMDFKSGGKGVAIGKVSESDNTFEVAEKWRPETLKKILQNEKYIGDALLQKTYTVDFLSKKRVQNKGIVPQYYVENSHEPIIPRDLYMQVQEEMIRRANLHSGANRKKRVYSSKYALSSIVYCSKCGEIYRRIAWNNRGKHSTVWRCCTRVEHGPTACDAPTIQEPDLQAAVVQAINLALGNRESMMATLQENVEAVILQGDETSSEGIEAKLLELQKELLKLANSKKDYNSVADEIDRLRELKQNALVESAEREGLKQRIRDMREFLEQQSTEVTEYDELLVRRLIEKVTVYDKRFEVKFKFRAKVDVER